MARVSHAVQLITYPDSLGTHLKDLRVVLEKYFPQEIIGGVHILPFFPSSADRGFAPLTQMEVDPQFGTWNDIRSLGERYVLMSDLIVNHISKESIYFQDYLQHGDKSPYRDFFITTEKFSRRIPYRYHPSSSMGNGAMTAHLAFDIFGSAVRDFLERYPVRFLEKTMNFFRKKDPLFHVGGVNRFSLKKVYRPRPLSPFVSFQFGDGRMRNVWCTFTSEQIDIDVDNPGVKELLRNTLKRFVENGISIVRLDAVGYAAKERGTSSFFISKTYRYVSWLAHEAHALGMTVLPEVHSHYSIQKKLSENPDVDYVYDFALPMLVLQALFSGENKNMLHWIKVRPNNVMTTLDTHDGLPVSDIEDLMTGEEKDETVKRVLENGGNSTMRASGLNAENVDIYQVNCTYYSALGKDDAAYITARAIQFFVPGVPQVYYVGLLAGENDMETLMKTNVGRDINRHPYTFSEIEENLKRPVVRSLMELMRLRNTHPAFLGEFKVEASPTDQLVLVWRAGDEYAILEADLKHPGQSMIRYSDLNHPKKEKQLLVKEMLHG